MKKLSLVAVAVCLFVGASFAGWDKFGVIDGGSAEAKLGYYGSNWSLNVRYGLMENLELFSTNGSVSSDYTVGARYQIIPVLAGFIDLDLPTKRNNFGLTPGINFSTNFTDALSLGSVVKLGIDVADPDPVMTLGVGVEVDYNFNDNIGIWVGVDLEHNLDNDFDAESAIKPGIGFFFSKDNLTVGTMINSIDFDHINSKNEKSIGITGGVEFGIKF